MPLYALDTETYEEDGQGELKPALNCQKFVLGIVKKEDGTKWVFRKPEEMYLHLLRETQENANEGKRSFFYAHNHEYDYYAYAQGHYFDSNIKYVNFTPFLAILDEKAYLLDSMAFYKTQLKDIGYEIGLPKMEMPGNPKNIEELIPYCERDVDIVLKAMLELKKTVKELGYNPKKMITAGQLAMTSFLTYLRRNEKHYLIMREGEVYKTQYPTLVRKAYRGGRNQAFQTGYYPEATLVDANSLYPYAMTQMRFPNLKKESFLEKPLDNFQLNEILACTGFLKATIKAKKTPLGVLPTRWNDTQQYPHDGESITSTWTTSEIAFALRTHCRLQDAEYAILYPDTENPFKPFLTELYELRMKTEGTKRQAVKLIMNNLYAKFAQNKPQTDYRLVKRTDLNEWIKRGYTPNTVAGADYIVAKKTNAYEPPYANPAISALTTAWARTFLHEHLLKIPFKDLLYTDTDSVIFKGKHLDAFTLGTKMGEWKIEHADEECRILGEKRYRIGGHAKASGIPKANLTVKAIDDAKPIKIRRMTTLADATAKHGDLSDIGTFREYDVQMTEHAKEKTLPREIVD